MPRAAPPRSFSWWRRCASPGPSVATSRGPERPPRQDAGRPGSWPPAIRAIWHTGEVSRRPLAGAHEVAHVVGGGGGAAPDPGSHDSMLTSDDPTRTAELLALSFAWEPARFSRRVHEIPSVMRAGPSDPGVISLAFGAPDPVFFP